MEFWKVLKNGISKFWKWNFVKYSKIYFRKWSFRKVLSWVLKGFKMVLFVKTLNYDVSNTDIDWRSENLVRVQEL